MSFYQNGILISGVNTLPELTRAQYEALPADKRPEYWVCLDEEYEPASGGHTIEDTDGTDMPQEDNLQFVGVYTEDDATNDRTKVNIVRPMTKEQYEALTPAQKKGFIRTTDEPDNPYNNTGNYSESEHIIGTWIDGSILYEKTISCGAMPNNDTKQVPHNISNISLIVDARGVTSMSNGTTAPLPYSHIADVKNQMGLAVDKTNIVLSTGSNRSGYTTTYVTLRYTK